MLELLHRLIDRQTIPIIAPMSFLSHEDETTVKDAILDPDVFGFRKIYHLFSNISFVSQKPRHYGKQEGSSREHESEDDQPHFFPSSARAARCDSSAMTSNASL